MGTLDLFGNPVRMRIVHALDGGRELTTAQLRARLPDVSQATVYRHVAAMERMGALDVASERKVRGVVERTYRLRRSAARLTEAELAELTPDDLRRTMDTIASVLVTEFGRALDDMGMPARQGTSMAQLSVWLTDEEAAELGEVVLGWLARHRDNPEQGRQRYLVTPVWFRMTSSD